MRRRHQRRKLLAPRNSGLEDPRVIFELAVESVCRPSHNRPPIGCPFLNLAGIAIPLPCRIKSATCRCTWPPGGYGRCDSHQSRGPPPPYCDPAGGGAILSLTPGFSCNRAIRDHFLICIIGLVVASGHRNRQQSCLSKRTANNEVEISTGHLARPYATGRVQLWCFIFTRGRCLGAWLRGGRCLSLRLRGDRSRRLRSVLFAGIEHSPAKYGKGRKHRYSHDTHYYVPLIPEAGAGFAGLARKGSGHDTPPCPHLDACTTNPHPQGSNASPPPGCVVQPIASGPCNRYPLEPIHLLPSDCVVAPIPAPFPRPRLGRPGSPPP